MGHPIHRVERFEIIGPYTLALHFADGTNQLIDFRPVLEGEVFGPLRNLQLFNAVELDPAFGTIPWPNGADFDPETLHDWPRYRGRLHRDGQALVDRDGTCVPNSGLALGWSRRGSAVADGGHGSLSDPEIADISFNAARTTADRVTVSFEIRAGEKTMIK